MILRLAGPLLLTMAAVTAAQGQGTSTLVARAHDPAGHLLSGVEVVINRREVRARTDTAGLVRFAVGPGDSTVGFRRIGYRPLLLTISPLPPAEDTILVELVPTVVELPELIATAPPTKPLRYAGTTKYDEVFLRKKLGLGSFLMREDLDRRFVMSTPELLQGIPGVRVTVGAPGAPDQNTVRLLRCPPAQTQVYVDGSLQRSYPHDLVGMLTRINPAEIEMIEIYRGPAQIPGVYHSDGCAVIALWTKWNR